MSWRTTDSLGEQGLIDWTGRELLILAFDHRTSFTGKLFGIKGRQPSVEERKQISEFKWVIFEGFKRALEKGVPKDVAGLLVDEEFGADVLREAKKSGLTFAMPVEKSGQDEFDFEHGEDYPGHVDKFSPTLVKVLVRYNPDGDVMMNKRQLERLHALSDYLMSIRKPFLFELLVPATEEQLGRAEGSKERYDREVRPGLMVGAMGQIQDADVEPTIWKLEGVEKAEDARAVVGQAQRDGRRAAVITLGRGESREMVQKWLRVGAKILGIIGFAVGRTIFWDPLVELKAGKITRDQAVEKVAQNYFEFSSLWLSEKKRG
jgi:5-dehydro-2-deoxygluconokinase